MNKLFRSFGYEIRHASESGAAGRAGRGSEFLHDERFEIEFTHLTLDGSQYFVPKYALHRPAVKNLLSGILYEPDTHRFVEEFFKAFKGSMVHAGTFFGDMLPDFSRSVPGNVYAFEPVFENYVLAKLCVDNNGLSNVILMNSALSDSLGNLFIDTSEGDGKHAGGGSAISDKGSICAAIDIDSLDIEDLALIQLDVEGHELIALAGAQETIQRCRPVIAIEDNNDNCAEFLSSIRYENAGHIPGLTIWVPAENDEYKQEIISILN